METADSVANTMRDLMAVDSLHDRRPKLALTRGRTRTDAPHKRSAREYAPTSSLPTSASSPPPAANAATSRSKTTWGSAHMRSPIDNPPPFSQRENRIRQTSRAARAKAAIAGMNANQREVPVIRRIHSYITSRLNYPALLMTNFQ